MKHSLYLTASVTDAGLKAIGIDETIAQNKARHAKRSTKTMKSRRAVKAKPSPKPSRPTPRKEPKKTFTTKTAPSRADTKQDQILRLLHRKEGATIEQMMKVTGWQAHSVRGALSGALRKKRGLAIDSTVRRDGVRIYRIAG